MGPNAAHTHPDSRPRRSAIRTTMVMRPCGFASPARTARTTRTKRKSSRNETDLSSMGEGQAVLSPLNLRLNHTSPAAVSSSFLPTPRPSILQFPRRKRICKITFVLRTTLQIQNLTRRFCKMVSRDSAEQRVWPHPIINLN